MNDYFRMPLEMVAPNSNRPEKKFDRIKYGDYVQPAKYLVIPVLAATILGIGSCLGFAAVNSFNVNGCNDFIKSECANLTPSNSTAVPDLFSRCAELNSYHNTYWQYPLYINAGSAVLACLGVAWLGWRAQKKMNNTPPLKFAELSEAAEKEKGNNARFNEVVDDNLKRYIKLNKKGFDTCWVVLSAACPTIVFWIGAELIAYLERQINCTNVCSLVNNITNDCQDWKTGDCIYDCYNENLQNTTLINSGMAIGAIAALVFSSCSALTPFYQWKQKKIEMRAIKLRDSKTQKDLENVVLSNELQLKDKAIKKLQQQLDEQKHRSEATINERNSVEDVNNQGRSSIATTASFISIDGASPISNRTDKTSPTSEVVVHVDDAPPSTLELTSITVTPQ